MGVAAAAFLATPAEAKCPSPTAVCVCAHSQIVAEATLTATDGRMTTARLDQLHGAVPDAGVPGEVQLAALPEDAPGQRALVFLYGESVDGGPDLQFSQGHATRKPIAEDGKVHCDYAATPVRLELDEAISLALDPSCDALLRPRLGNPGCHDTGFACSGAPAHSALALLGLSALVLSRRRPKRRYLRALARYSPVEHRRSARRNEYVNLSG